MTLYVLMCGCIEEFVPEVEDFKQVLVVEGFISDAESPYTIMLSRTRPIDSEAMVPEVSAQVYVTDQEGAIYYFAEAAPGIYQSNPAEFRGVIGYSYILNLVTADNQRYASSEVRLKKTPAIDSVYFESSTRLTEAEGDTLHGIAILLDAHDDENATRHYRWEWEEAWEIKVPYPNTYDWVLYPVLDPTSERAGYEVQHNRQLGTCYSSASSSGILIGNSVGLAQDRISQHELTYVSTEGYKLGSMYSILVSQYALDQQEYSYWLELQKSSETMGTLFDPQPYELAGNVKNINDPAEAVLGYFGASTVSKKRVFISRRQLLDVEYPTNPCVEEKVEVWNPYVQNYIDAGYLIAHLGSYGSPNYFLAPGPCCDCTYHGVLEKPDFWPY